MRKLLVFWVCSFGSSVLLAACGGPAELGGGCDPEAETPCVEGLACLPGAEGENLCQIPYGGECDFEADEPFCAPGSACTEVTETVDGEEVQLGRCYIQEGNTCDPNDSHCDPALTCAELQDGSYECHRPVLFRGRVFDSTDDAAIEGAHVLGLDEESVAVTDVAVSEADGSYDLRVPVVRQADGTPIEDTFTLRSSADGYQTFPGGIRTALPINTALAAEQEAGWVVEGTITDIALIPVADPSAPRVSVSGSVVAEGQVGGVVVVAESAADAFSAVTDTDGQYTIFNVSPGDYEVRGYIADLQLTPVPITAADADLVDVDLVQSEAALTTISGMTNIVNAPCNMGTSIVLAVESTFTEAFGRGETPPGLRAPRTGPPTIDGAWTIEGVPDGRYVVLAAFENDCLVRDPDLNIAGTGLVRIEVPADAGALSADFKITEALAVVSPGPERPEAVSSAPTLEWADDSSEDYYTVQVFNAYGEMVWEETDVPAVSGSPTVAVPYAGPLEPGMYYQFRATSWRSPGGNPSPVSTTEDLLGVFYYEP